MSSAVAKLRGSAGGGGGGGGGGAGDTSVVSDADIGQLYVYLPSTHTLSWVC